MRPDWPYSESSRPVIKKPESVKKVESPRKPPFRRSSWNASIAMSPSARRPSRPGWYFKRPVAMTAPVLQGVFRATRRASLAQPDLGLRDFPVVLEAHERASAVATPGVQRRFVPAHVARGHQRARPADEVRDLAV